jgi:hypothetical protein
MESGDWREKEEEEGVHMAGGGSFHDSFFGWVVSRYRQVFRLAVAAYALQDGL